MPDDAGQQGPVSLHDLAINTQRDPNEEDPDANKLWMPDTPAPFPCPTIAAYQIVGLDVCRCTLTMLGHLSSMANVLLRNTSLSTVRDCSILTLPPPGPNSVTTAWGGLQLAGGCESVEVIHNEIRGGMGHGITLGSARFEGGALGAFPDIFSAGNHGVIDPGDDCPGLYGGLDEAIPPGDGLPVPTTPDTPLNTITIVDNLIHKMHGSGISVLAFWPEPTDLAAFKMIEAHDLLIDRNRIIDNYQKPAETQPDPGYLDVLAFGGITLAAADDLQIFDNIITDNGVDHIRPVCGVFVLHGENINIERNRIKRNGPRITGDGTAGIRAGIAIQMAGRRIDYDETGGLGDVDEDRFDGAAGIRGNVVIQPVGRALQLYGLGPMVVTGNHFVGGGLTGAVPQYEAHAVEIINLGQSPELISDGTMPSFYGFLPVPPIQGDPNMLDERLIDGRILYSNNQARLVVDGAPAERMHCAFRLLSHGDIMMQGNQHITTFDRSVGHLTFSTTAIGWSVNVSNNRSQDTHLDDSDPAGPLPPPPALRPRRRGGPGGRSGSGSLQGALAPRRRVRGHVR